jgi:hypothetical protein
MQESDNLMEDWFGEQGLESGLELMFAGLNQDMRALDFFQSNDDSFPFI